MWSRPENPGTDITVWSTTTSSGKTLDISDLPRVWLKNRDGEDGRDKVDTLSPQIANNGEKGARHPYTTPYMRVMDQSSDRKGWKLWSEHLTGLIGWWRRQGCKNTAIFLTPEMPYSNPFLIKSSK